MAGSAWETGFEWVGGVSISGGESLHGKPLVEARGQARHMRAAIDNLALAFAAGQPVPAWLYALGGNWGWKRQARRNRVKTPLTRRPQGLRQPPDPRRRDYPSSTSRTFRASDAGLNGFWMKG